MLDFVQSQSTSDKNSVVLENIKNLVEKTLAVYQADASRVIADYRAEKQYTADYDGRQILELLQNADDAETDTIYIEINTETKTLTISNNGIPFSLSGVKSLMLANMSPKNKKEYIGNKGLGFRSILNWVNRVDVITQDTVLKFSEQFAKENYNKIIKNNPDLLHQVTNDKNLANGEVPFAVLAVPDLKMVEVKGKWITTIKLHYKAEKEEESILTQLDAIQEETLLFLKHTKNITILKNDEAPRVYEKSFPSKDKIQVNEKIWSIFHSGERAYDATKMFSYQIAWQDDLSDEDAVFYTYFPTNVKTHLPCLIHATFELNSSRKDINPTPENLHILNEIADTLGELAITKLAISPPNWQPYKFLNPRSSHDNSVLDKFYKTILESKRNLAIYPATDDAYYRKDELFNYKSDFSTWVLKNNLGDYFPKLLRPLIEGDIKIENDLKNSNRYTPEELLLIINTINPKLIDLRERAALIKLLIADSFVNIHNSDLRLPLLIDIQDGLPTNNQLFTKRIVDISSLTILSFVTGMSFIHSDFYKILEDVFDEDIKNDRIKSDKNEKEDVSRILKRIIDKVVNIGSNDIIDVIRYIVGETRKQIKIGSIDKEVIVKNLVNSLYSIFKENPDRRGKLPLSIPLLSRNKSLVNSDDLYFGRQYHEGQLTEYIFEGIYDENDYLAGDDFYELNFDSAEESISFYTWLGVNKYIKFQKDDIEVEPPNKYQEFVFKSRPDLQRTYHYFKGIRVLDETIFGRLTIEKLLVLISKDFILKAQLEENHSDTYKYKYGSGSPKNLYGFPSFIEFQIAKAVDFSKYIIEKEIGIEHLFKSVDFENDLFSKYSISIPKIKVILEKLGAVKSLDDISIDQFYSLFNNQEEMFHEGRGSSTFYKRFLEYCTKNKESSKIENSFDFSEFKCFARKGGLKENPIELQPVSKIYYSDNNLVPQDVLDKYSILYLSKRLGEQNVKKYFGVNLIQDVLKTIHLDKDKLELSPLNREFNEHINKLKPYFLFYRLDIIKDENAKNDAINLTKNIDIKLVKNCSYYFDSGEKYFLQENFFIKIGSTYYIKNESCTTLESLTKNLVFRDTVAEVLNTQYKVKEHHDRFRAIFKDSILETEYVIFSKDGDKLLNLAKELLGISTLEIKFWTNIYMTLGKTFPDSIISQDNLEKALALDLNYILPSDYHEIDFNNLSKKETFDFLKKIVTELPINLSDIVSWDTKGFSVYYNNLLLDQKQDYKLHFEKLLWEKLNESNKLKEQQEFLNILFAYQLVVESSEMKKGIDYNYLVTDWDIKEYFKETLKKLFSIDLKIDSKVETLTNLYVDVVDEYGIEENLIPHDVKSLFYFDGHEVLITKYLNDLNIATKSLEKEVINPDLVGKLHIGSSKKLMPNEFSKKGNSPWSHGSKDISKNKRIGKKAESLVYNTLVNEYGKDNVQWMSSFSETSLDKADSYHFDIAYKPADEWKYLEIKAFNGRYFHLSREEKHFGMKYPLKYELALAYGEDVFIFNNLFKEGVDFENNPYFKAIPSDYIISLEIEK